MNLLASSSSGEHPMPNGDGEGEGDGDGVMADERDDGDGGGEDENKAVQTCIECEDQFAELVCLSCDEPFCRPCWGSLHRQGKRAEHVTQAILGEVMPAPSAPATTAAPDPPTPPADGEAIGNGNLGGGGGVDVSSSNSELSDSEESAKGVGEDRIGGGGGGGGGSGSDAGEEGGGGSEACEGGQEEGRLLSGDGAPKTKGKRRAKRGSKSLGKLAVGLHGMSVLEESRFIPLRLDARERGLLAMLKGALNVSEYTDRVDVYTGRWGGSKARTIKDELRFALAALSGMMVAGDRNWGQKNADLLDTLEENQDAFAEIFEVGRRYKITNPEKFRDFYGKMMYMLQDAQAQGRVDLVNDIKMVYDLVEDRGGLEMLHDERLVAATADISGISMTKAEVDDQVAAKNKARAELLKEYVSDSFSRGEVERVLDSIADANNYIAFNVAPVERTIDLLTKNFHPDKPEAEWSLKLSAGSSGRKR